MTSADMNLDLFTGETSAQSIQRDQANQADYFMFSWWLIVWGVALVLLIFSFAEWWTWRKLK